MGFDPAYKAQVVEAADEAILERNVQVGNPADTPQLAPAIERITVRTGRGCNRTELTAIRLARTCCGHGVFAHNLVKIATLTA